MDLNDLLSVIEISAPENCEIRALALDSRKVVPGTLFFAYPGSVSDGRDFMRQAEDSGAIAMLYDPLDFVLPTELNVICVAVPNLQMKVGYLAHEYYGRACEHMQVFGVTGTNGKTTCCYLLTQALTQLGMQAAMIGTIGVGRLSALSTALHTTPDPISLHQTLAELKSQGITQVCMEVSSHALDQGRVSGIQFFCTLFTNLSHDHLDYHGSMENYGAAKQRLFKDYSSELVVTNAADPLGASLIDIASSEFIVSYGQGGDIYAETVNLKTDGIELEFDSNNVNFSVKTPLIGAVNVPNLEMLVATLLALSIEISDIKSILTQLTPAPGRMELYRSTDSASVVVDYAHTPDALEKALKSIRQHCSGKLWCVFGCGGDRDRAKRPVMGEIADRLADKVIVTNDNPRSEDPTSIASDIAKGFTQGHSHILDRATAISESIRNANSNDWVLIAGKGHETTQQIGDAILRFSDRDCVSSVIEAIR